MGKFEEALEEYAKYVIQQAKSNLTRKKQRSSGKLYNSLKYNITKRENDAIIEFDMVNYGAFQDEGVKGRKTTYPESTRSRFKYTTKMPPARSLDKWTVKKGIAPRDSKGRFISRKSLNWLIARGIYNRGIRATMFFTKPFERGLQLYRKQIMDGYIDDLINK